MHANIQKNILINSLKVIMKNGFIVPRALFISHPWLLKMCFLQSLEIASLHNIAKSLFLFMQDNFPKEPGSYCLMALTDINI